jgi:hypothetical protein
MTVRAPSLSSETIAVRFRREIERAEAEGTSRADMVLHLTLNDADRLRRDRAVPIPDISYAGGPMRYLGVLVESGGVAHSVLEIPHSA